MQNLKMKKIIINHIQFKRSLVSGIIFNKNFLFSSLFLFLVIFSYIAYTYYNHNSQQTAQTFENDEFADYSQKDPVKPKTSFSENGQNNNILPKYQNTINNEKDENNLTDGTFPYLDQGKYVGTITNLLGLSKIPFGIISEDINGTKELTFIIGIEGIAPIIIPVEPGKNDIRLASNGMVFQF